MKLIKKYQLGSTFNKVTSGAMTLIKTPFEQLVDAGKRIINQPTKVSNKTYNKILEFEGTNLENLPPVDYGKDIKDANGHKTYGPGLLFDPTGEYMDKKKSSYTADEIRQLYKETMNKIARNVYLWAVKNNVLLNQNLFDAIVSACHNFGAGFLNKQIMKQLASGNYKPRQLKNLWTHLSDALTEYPGLKKRRAWEAKLFFSPVK